MTAVRRSKLEIYLRVLDLFNREGAVTGEANLTTVARLAKIPYGRFLEIMSKLIENNLVLQTSTGIRVTGNGLTCLQKMRRASDFFRGIGLTL